MLSWKLWFKPLNGKCMVHKEIHCKDGSNAHILNIFKHLFQTLCVENMLK